MLFWSSRDFLPLSDNIRNRREVHYDFVRIIVHTWYLRGSVAKSHIEFGNLELDSFKSIYVPYHLFLRNSLHTLWVNYTPIWWLLFEIMSSQCNLPQGTPGNCGWGDNLQKRFLERESWHLMWWGINRYMSGKNLSLPRLASPRQIIGATKKLFCWYCPSILGLY